MNIGFDPDAHEFRVLWCRGHKLVARYCGTAYTVLPDEPAYRQLLVDSRLPFGRCEGHLLLLDDGFDGTGNEPRFPVRSLMPGGRLPEEDVVATEILIAELDALIPRSPAGNSRCGFCLPATTPIRGFDSLRSTRDFFHQWLQLRGYSGSELTPGHALILAELAETDFTGLAICFGTSFSSYSLSIGGTEILAGYVAKGSDWINLQLANAWRLNSVNEPVSEWSLFAKLPSGSEGSLPVRSRPVRSRPETEADLLRDLCRAVMTEVSKQAREHLAVLTVPVPRSGITLLAGGSLARMDGMLDELKQLWIDPGMLYSIDRVQLADSSPFTIARGCLIYTELETTGAKQVA